MALQVEDDPGFILGQHFGADLVYSQAPCDRLGGAFVVARGHDDPQAEVVQLFERGWGGVLDRVRDADQAGDPAVEHYEHDRLALVAARVGRGVERSAVKAKIGHQLGIAERHRLTVDHALDALAGDRFEILRFGHIDPAFLCAGDDGFGQGMLGAALERGGESKHLRLVMAFLRQHRD